MSTAGKVLVVLVMLTSLVWMVLSAGVSQLNTNGNTRLHDLTEQIAKLQADFTQTQDEIASLRDRLRRSKKTRSRGHRAPCESVRSRKGSLSNCGDALAQFNISSRQSRKPSNGPRRLFSIELRSKS